MDEGREILGRIDKFANEQVVEALKKVPLDSSPQQILDGIRGYSAALRAERLGEAVKAVGEIIVISGYRPGLFGSCLDMHMRYCSRTVGFGVSFEAQIATRLGEVLNRLERPRNEVWMATDGMKIFETIFIDGEGLGENKAHLRALIVDDALRGRVFGRRLIEKAMDFVGKQEFPEIHLYNFKGLGAA